MVTNINYNYVTKVSNEHFGGNITLFLNKILTFICSNNAILYNN